LAEALEMSETRKLAAILVSDVVGYSRLAGADEDRILARLRTLRSDLIDPTIAVHHGRIVKRTGDGSIVEFRSVVDAVRCAIEVQNGMRERNTGVPEDRRIQFRVGIHLGDVVEESDGDLMGDGVNIAARLQSIAQPGAICLSEQAYWQVKQRLDLKVNDLGPTELKNIAEPIHVYSLEVGQPGGRQLAPAPEKSAPPRLSIVVLPFANLGGDPQQEYFVDGVTESLTTDLSRIRGSFVISRNTAFTYKGKSVDVKQVGRELNVRYALEGSIQRGGNRVRVNVQLVDAENGAHLWAERFDKPVADLLDMQDEIVARLANELSAELVAVEARRAERAPHPDVMDLYFQGMAHFHKGLAPDHLAAARDFFEGALAVDPDNVNALSAIAAVDAFRALGLYGDRVDLLACAEIALSKALALAPNHALAHVNMALVLNLTNRAELAILEAERALALDRNRASAYTFVAQAKVYLGRSEDAVSAIREAIGLSPRDPFSYGWLTVAGVAALALGDDEGAANWLRQSIEVNRNYSPPHFYLAAALANLGRIKEAKVATQTGLSLNPNFTIARYRLSAPSDNPTFLAQRERFYEGMRKAGVPEG
jgi:TolB-like protein/class 3 adenylate cyclase/lipoprotein NlpI